MTQVHSKSELMAGYMQKHIGSMNRSAKNHTVFSLVTLYPEISVIFDRNRIAIELEAKVSSM